MCNQLNCRCELVFEKCFVPEENVLGQEGKGIYINMIQLMTNSIMKPEVS